MRPIYKGPVPMVDGLPKQVADYKDWRHDLLHALGNCCCYCNMPLNDSPQVEHVSPKNPQPGQAPGAFLDWVNMVLACGPCNRAKSNRPVSAASHYLAEFHNTHLVFEYVVVAHPTRQNKFACIPRPSSVNGVDKSKAAATIDLCKLDQIKKIDSRATDLRWEKRFQAMLAAKTWKQSWDDWGMTMEHRFIPLLLTAAIGHGFFSVWMQVFAGSPSVCNALIKEFPGTARDCFDPTGQPIPRNGQSL